LRSEDGTVETENKDRWGDTTAEFLEYTEKIGEPVRWGDTSTAGAPRIWKASG